MSYKGKIEIIKEIGIRLGEQYEFKPTINSQFVKNECHINAKEEYSVKRMEEVYELTCIRTQGDEVPLPRFSCTFPVSSMRELWKEGFIKTI